MTAKINALEPISAESEADSANAPPMKDVVSSKKKMWSDAMAFSACAPSTSMKSMFTLYSSKPVCPKLQANIRGRNAMEN
jgi:hypothetical protein